eukprot:gnl/TRDRNA2_/TRDRNA2_205943_c0_seq1.p2 gnl/TRDRNA2_/TRDRNA2_205943_c0~~gnl/TRDRNA2_/TRDRNA2_205943_c0_seq1.p2  ORF type:complete len:125 (-),score=20.77 gnl/TRDRNA2_/TRDRNA2_205943_c0_seq1:352-726(-)
MVGLQVRKLRMRLFVEHLGLCEDDAALKIIENPATDSAFKLWVSRAQANTDIIVRAFPTAPSNLIKTREAFKEAQGKPTSTVDLDEGKYQGQLIQYPGLFMSEGLKTIRGLFLETLEATDEIFH